MPGEGGGFGVYCAFFARLGEGGEVGAETSCHTRQLLVFWLFDGIALFVELFLTQPQSVDLGR